MKLAVIGTGYVGLVTGTCFAEMGNQVVCVDNDKRKIDLLNNSRIPIWEPGLEELVKRNHAEKRLSFTGDIKKAVEESLVIFIAVGTPPDEDGSADLQYVLQVAREIAQNMNEYKIIVNKSTVPVGTAERVKKVIQEVLDSRKVDLRFDVVSNPEFLKEGAAIEDFMKPDRVIVGTDKPEVGELMKVLYSPFNRTTDRVIVMSVKSAEMTKYAANAMLATKISFINEIALLCEKLGADVSEVRIGIGSDTRIGYKFIYPGVGYGGSCFPKDVKALIHMAKETGIEPSLLEAVELRNARQKEILIEKIDKRFAGDLAGKIFAVWGLAFKPQTDDIREAPSVVIINQLLQRGAKIQVFDPVAVAEAQRVLGYHPHIKYSSDEYEALKDAVAMLLVTEWHQFRYPDFARMKQNMQSPIIFDGRNQYDPRQMKEQGFEYYSIGRS
ncbi:MAG TPA: UDP-glucose/GDP-mannose dehydrogenase family protein [Candidatus Cloacimonadota bacterium]|nr:UDP-glucose/GDP-mannose dehydrogenase family protein [Candidatus Cloacimonadota bacterium]HPS37895.1 UDP-glucose/GDP-mannose dehydrogenase family protein [Candidatus Cloacimonadota bacterium]